MSMFFSFISGLLVGAAIVFFWDVGFLGSFAAGFFSAVFIAAFIAFSMLIAASHSFSRKE